MTNAIIYLRCSSRGQAKNGHSLERQLRACLEHATANGWGVRDVYCDAGASGYEPEKLPQRNALLQRYGGLPDSIVNYPTCRRHVDPRLRLRRRRRMNIPDVDPGDGDA